jgi:hypothetical protein
MHNGFPWRGAACRSELTLPPMPRSRVCSELAASLCRESMDTHGRYDDVSDARKRRSTRFHGTPYLFAQSPQYLSCSTKRHAFPFTMPGDGHRLAGTRCTKKISTCDAVTSCKVGALGCSHSSVVNTGKEVKGVVRRRRRSLRGRTTLQRCRKEDGRRLHRHCQSGRRSRLGGGCAPWFLTTRHTERSRVRFVLAGRTHARRGACGIV